MPPSILGADAVTWETFPEQAMASTSVPPDTVRATTNRPPKRPEPSTVIPAGSALAVSLARVRSFARSAGGEPAESRTVVPQATTPSPSPGTVAPPVCQCAGVEAIASSELASSVTTRV